MVGCGNIAERHAQAIAKYATLIAVCDSDESKAKNMAQAHQCNSYQSLPHMLAAETRLDVITICTPNWLHAAQSIYGLQNNLHVVCEKPMAINVFDAEQMITAAQKAGKKLFVIKQLRQYRQIKFLKQLIEENALGNIYSFHINCFWNRNKEYYNGWHGSLQKDGGTLYTQFSHYIDLVLWLFGSVAHTQFTKTNIAHPQLEFEDCGIINFNMASGAIGNFSYSVNAYQKNFENSITIMAQKGSIKLQGMMLENFEYFNVENVALPAFSTIDKIYSHYDTYENIVNDLQQNTSTATYGLDSVASIKLIADIYSKA